MKKISFIIVSPLPFAGGPICLHYLCKLLSDKGYDSRVFLTLCPEGKKQYDNKIIFIWNHLKYVGSVIKKTFFSFFATHGKKLDLRHVGIGYPPVKNIKIKYLPFFNKSKTIIIYPDLVYGNFLRAKNVVRWLLYYNRYPCDSEAYGKNDLFFSFREIYNDDSLNPTKRVLTLNYFNLDLYKQTNFGERTGNCYLIKKGRNRNDLPEFFDGPILDVLSEDGKVKTLNECRFCIIYDMQTSYASIAALCGCIPILIPEQGRSREDYYSPEEILYGIAFGKSQEEIDWAIKTRGLLIEQFKKMGIDDSNKIDEFERICIDYFKINAL